MSVQPFPVLNPKFSRDFPSTDFAPCHYHAPHSPNFRQNSRANHFETSHTRIFFRSILISRSRDGGHSPPGDCCSSHHHNTKCAPYLSGLSSSFKDNITHTMNQYILRILRISLCCCSMGGSKTWYWCCKTIEVDVCGFLMEPAYSCNRQPGVFSPVSPSVRRTRFT